MVAPAGAGAGIAPREGEMIAVVPYEFGQEALALLRRHQAVEQYMGERRGLREHRSQVHVACAQLFHDDARGESVRARAARLLGQGERAQSHLRGLVEQVHEQRLLEGLQAVRVEGGGLDLGFDEVAHRIAEFQLFGSEAQVVHVTIP